MLVSAGVQGQLLVRIAGSTRHLKGEMIKGKQNRGPSWARWSIYRALSQSFQRAEKRSMAPCCWFVELGVPSWLNSRFFFMRTHSLGAHIKSKLNLGLLQMCLQKWQAEICLTITISQGALISCAYKMKLYLCPTEIPALNSYPEIATENLQNVQGSAESCSPSQNPWFCPAKKSESHKSPFNRESKTMPL